MVGAYKSEEDFGYLRDDVGDNISDRNIQYSELTGLYWAWKNASEDLIGLCHYRRYFSKSIFKSTQIIDKTDVTNALENHDFIVHQRRYPISNGDWLMLFVDESFLEKSKQIFRQVHPEYYETLEQVYNSKTTYGYSCFVTNKKTFDEYCEWLFDYLTVLENELDGSRTRILGYYAEVLLTIFINHNNLNVKKFSLYYVESKSNFIANCIDKSIIFSKIFHTLQWKYVPRIKSKLKRKK